MTVVLKIFPHRIGFRTVIASRMTLGQRVGSDYHRTLIDVKSHLAAQSYGVAEILAGTEANCAATVRFGCFDGLVNRAGVDRPAITGGTEEGAPVQNMCTQCPLFVPFPAV